MKLSLWIFQEFKKEERHTYSSLRIAEITMKKMNE